ncbi:unnamed protein product [Ilex paraguariensis]|uniref:Pentatricopeptide repeat-containing protein n=1 Tax=Ilex paraguariensis TaxID=185542 RepID=A0ABC8UZ80_9AQUA
MRNQWRLLLLCRHSLAQPHISRHLSQFSDSDFQVNSLRFFSSSLLHSLAPHVPLPPFISQLQNLPSPSFRYFSSSELAVEHKNADEVVLVTDIFSKGYETTDEMKVELESNNVVISHELVLKVLQDLNAAPEVAKSFFDWVSERENDRLSSKSYNLMLGMLGVNGFVNEFWDMVGIMKKKGYGVSKGTFSRVSEKFEKERMGSDLEKLKELYASGWIEESGLFKHDERTYNALALVLAKEDCVEKFWRVIHEMRGGGYEMEKGTYIKVLRQFVKRKMVKDAVDFYEFAMTGKTKPSVQDCTYLLRKIMASKELNMGLFMRVVRVFKDSGNVLTNSTIDAVLKSLTSVGRIGKCNKILKALEEGGLSACDPMKGKIAFQLSSRGEKGEASEFMNNMEASGHSLHYKTWASLIERHCIAGDQQSF